MPPPYCYDYPRPAVTVDLAIFAIEEEELRILLIRRKHEPFAGQWALPGGFLEMGESIEAGARRELREETGLDASGPVAFLGAFGDPGRDPRGRTISLAHVAVLRGTPPGVQGGDDANEAAWRIAPPPGPLAFDHESIIANAMNWLSNGIKVGRLGLELLPEEFGELEVKMMHRAIFRATKGASPWLRRMLKEGQVERKAGSDHLFHSIRRR
ncbi:NUDIX domain-containing protein [Tundrisphaera lichenicola]|uniref:NUDIX domain-containing protein n=1 Tax=Tundrisphaera lichenicola TaxID=2029860 RepID=UPI003EB762C8